MGNKIEFPLNGKIYFEKGLAALEQGQEEQGIDYLNRAAEMTDNPEVNAYAGLVLFAQGKYEEALAIMDKEKDFFINDEEESQLYVNLLIRNNRFIDAEYIIKKYNRLEGAVEVDEEWDYLEYELNEKRAGYNSEEQASEEYLIEILKKMTNHPASIQLKELNKAKTLKLATLQDLAPTILVDSQLAENTRRAYLEMLIERNDTNTYSFLWFDEIRTVQPINLPIFNEIQMVHQLLEKLEEKLNKDPGLYFLTQAKLIEDLLLIYPYIDEVVTDSDFWVDLYIMELDLLKTTTIERLAMTEEEIKMRKMVSYLNRLQNTRSYQ